MNVHISKAWKSTRLDGIERSVIYFNLGSTSFVYQGNVNQPRLFQYIGSDQGSVRIHRRELNATSDRYADIRTMIENMITRGEVTFGPAPAI